MVALKAKAMRTEQELDQQRAAESVQLEGDVSDAFADAVAKAAARETLWSIKSGPAFRNFVINSSPGRVK